MEVEAVLEVFREFEQNGTKDACPVLDGFLSHVARTGQTLIQWSQFKSYFLYKLEKVMNDFQAAALEECGLVTPNLNNVPFDEMKDRILTMANGFNGIPFTIQRLCELLTEPGKNYSRTDAFLRGLEKNMMVVTCICPSSAKSSSENTTNAFTGDFFAFLERSINGPDTPRPPNRPKPSVKRFVLADSLLDGAGNGDHGVPPRELSSEEGSTAVGSPLKMAPLDDGDPKNDEAEILRFDHEPHCPIASASFTLEVGGTKASSESSDTEMESPLSQSDHEMLTLLTSSTEKQGLPGMSSVMYAEVPEVGGGSMGEAAGESAQHATAELDAARGLSTAEPPMEP